MLKHIFKLTKENKLLQSMNNPVTILFFEVVSLDSRLGTIPLKTVTLCSHTTFPALLPVLENLLEAIKRLLLWPRYSRYESEKVHCHHEVSNCPRASVQAIYNEYPPSGTSDHCSRTCV